MTIKNLLDQGIAIEGSVIIRQWNDDINNNTDYTYLHITSGFRPYEVSEDIKNREIKYMFANINAEGTAYLIIEVSNE